MKPIRALALIATLAVALLIRLSPAAPNDSQTDPAQAGSAYLLQGEYVGMRGPGNLGAQVVALGNDEFRVIFLNGGLPGAGWDGGDRARAQGKLADGAIRFIESGWDATLTGGAITGKDPAGAALNLRRVDRHSPTEGQKPPAGARVLFDGTGVSEWENGKLTPEGWLECGSRTRRAFRDFTLHLEFRTPFKPQARGQSRGNSGVYIFSRYEIQVLDSFGLDGKDNECGAVYRQRAPTVNMCFPPLAWQTYDLDFQAARFDEQGTKTRNAVITLKHNGVAVHDRYEIPQATGGGARLGENLGEGPILIQNHGNPVRLRNVWIVERRS